MNVFTISADNNITVYASRKAARETAEAVFATEEDLSEIIGSDGKRVVEIWNSLTGVTPVRKFTNRATGITRIWKEIQKLRATSVTAEESAVDTPAAPQTPHVAPEEVPMKTRAKRAKKADVVAPPAAGPREGSKTSRVIAMLKREGGATLNELITEMGWLQHTTRALMSAGGSLAKKHGLTVVSAKGENGARVYSINA